MGRKKRNRLDPRLEACECVYCGSRDRLTFDHVPPQNLFSIPRPGNLIKVPCCHSCNKGFSKDDEYFRLMVVLRHDIGSHPQFKNLWPTVYRSLLRRREHGFTNGLLQSMARVDVQSPGGLFLGQLPTYSVDLVRLDRTAARITKGLFYHEFGSRLPDDYCAVSYNKSGFGGNVAGVELVNSMCAKLFVSPPKTIGANVFSYWFQRTSDNPNASVWLMLFFGAFPFFCLTIEKTLAAKRTHTVVQAPQIEM